MSDLIYVSRNFTEFGGFKPAEVKDFIKRSVLLETDFLKIDGSDEWLPVSEWNSASSGSTTNGAGEAKAPARTAKKAARGNGKTTKAQA